MSLKPADLALIDPFDAIGAGVRPACRMANWQQAYGGADTAMLTDAERTRAGRLKSPEHQREMTASFVLRRWLVADMTGCAAEDVRFEAQESGAPLLLAPSGYAISLANKRTLTVVALDRAGAAIGVDVEIVRATEWRPMLATICDEDERVDFLARSGESPAALTAFFRMWTLKEAVLKTTGQGFRAGPKAVRVSAGDVSGTGRGTVNAFAATFDYWTADQGEAIVTLVRRR
jgi:4'-phosphopantetheinyl transferase